MIKIYESGSDLVRENNNLLDTNKYLSCFFAIDAPLLTKTDKINYAVKSESGANATLAMKVEPYNMLLFGSPDTAEELVDFLMLNGYEIKGVLGGEPICDKMSQILKSKYGIEYYEALAFDFMEATEKTEPSSNEIETPSEADLGEIVDCIEHFISDCGLLDKLDEKEIRKTLSRFRIIRADGKIVSIAKAAPSTESDMRISCVYTRPEYRGKGYAKKVVNTLKNEILSADKKATLNVDKKNPVSNNLYASLGFVKVFSQGEYRRK